MLPSAPHPLRYPLTARRSQIARLVATGALVLFPVACGANDEDAFRASSTTTPAAANATGTAATTETPPSSAAASTTVPEPIITTVPPDSAIRAAAEMVVNFTYSSVGSTGPVRNPYIAVWVEDTNGNLVQTISLWYEQSGKGTRWLNDLRGWYSTSGGDVTTSGATRTAGAYSVAWDGTDLYGTPVATGDYVLYVEAAREHGPYSITSAPITVDADGFAVTLDDNGELSNVSATLTV